MYSLILIFLIIDAVLKSYLRHLEPCSGVLDCFASSANALRVLELSVVLVLDALNAVGQLLGFYKVSPVNLEGTDYLAAASVKELLENRLVSSVIAIP